jgi:hypothetical protein
VQTVLETVGYRKDCEAAGLTEEERLAIVSTLASNPTAGDLIPGSGGARKLRVAGRGKGKSGGYRVVTYFGGFDVPVFLPALFSKGERGNISKAELNELREILPKIGENYRMAVKARVRLIKK